MNANQIFRGDEDSREEDQVFPYKFHLIWATFLWLHFFTHTMARKERNDGVSLKTSESFPSIWRTSFSPPELNVEEETKWKLVLCCILRSAAVSWSLSPHINEWVVFVAVYKPKQSRSWITASSARVGGWFGFTFSETRGTLLRDSVSTSLRRCGTINASSFHTRLRVMQFQVESPVFNTSSNTSHC